MGASDLHFDIALVRDGATYRMLAEGPTLGSRPVTSVFALPFSASELAQFMVAVGPPRVAARRLVPAGGRVLDVRYYGARLGDALLDGEVGVAYRDALKQASSQGKGLRLRLRLEQAPDLEPVPWEYLYDRKLDRFLALSRQTPVVRLLDAIEDPPPFEIDPPLRVLVLISSPSDMPELAVEREAQLLQATTADLVDTGQMELVQLRDATLGALQRALLEEYHVLHFIGHGGFDQEWQEGVLVLEREDGTAHRVSASRLGTLLHDARGMQLALLNACEGARTSGRDAFSGVAQELVRRGLPAVVAMQTEISDRAALVFAHEFYSFLTRGLPIDEVMSEVRKAMAVSDEASEWGTAILLRSGSSQPFAIHSSPAAQPRPEARWDALYQGAQSALADDAPETALTMLTQLDAEHPDYLDVTQLIERIAPEDETTPLPAPVPTPAPTPVLPVVTPAPPWRRLVPVVAATVVALVAIVWGAQYLPSLGGGFPDPPDPAPSSPSTRQPTTTGGVPPTTEPTNTGGADAVTLACGPAGSRVAPGDLTAACATTATTIDGRLGDDEWIGLGMIEATTEVAPNPGDLPGDIAGLWMLRWDREALYLGVRVIDPELRWVDVGQPGAFWKGDSISFEFGAWAADLGAGASVRDGVDRHVMIGLGPDGAVAAVNVAANGNFPSGRLEPRITAVAITDGLGYQIEARVPWEVLGVEVPSRGQAFAANLNVSDAAGSSAWDFGRMVSSNPDRTASNQPHPGTWQTLVLADG